MDRVTECCLDGFEDLICRLLVCIKIVLCFPFDHIFPARDFSHAKESQSCFQKPNNCKPEVKVTNKCVQTDKCDAEPRIEKRTSCFEITPKSCDHSTNAEPNVLTNTGTSYDEELCRNRKKNNNNYCGGDAIATHDCDEDDIVQRNPKNRKQQCDKEDPTIVVNCPCCEYKEGLNLSVTCEVESNTEIECPCDEDVVNSNRTPCSQSQVDTTANDYECDGNDDDDCANCNDDDGDDDDGQEEEKIQILEYDKKQTVKIEYRSSSSDEELETKCRGIKVHFSNKPTTMLQNQFEQENKKQIIPIYNGRTSKDIKSKEKQVKPPLQSNFEKLKGEKRKNGALGDFTKSYPKGLPNYKTNMEQKYQNKQLNNQPVFNRHPRNNFSPTLDKGNKQKNNIDMNKSLKYNNTTTASESHLVGNQMRTARATERNILENRGIKNSIKADRINTIKDSQNSAKVYRKRLNEGNSPNHNNCNCYPKDNMKNERFSRSIERAEKQVKEINYAEVKKENPGKAQPKTKNPEKNVRNPNFNNGSIKQTKEPNINKNKQIYSKMNEEIVLNNAEENQKRINERTKNKLNAKHDNDRPVSRNSNNTNEQPSKVNKYVNYEKPQQKNQECYREYDDNDDDIESQERDCEIDSLTNETINELYQKTRYNIKRKLTSAITGWESSQEDDKLPYHKRHKSITSCYDEGDEKSSFNLLKNRKVTPEKDKTKQLFGKECIVIEVEAQDTNVKDAKMNKRKSSHKVASASSLIKINRGIGNSYQNFMESKIAAANSTDIDLHEQFINLLSATEKNAAPETVPIDNNKMAGDHKKPTKQRRMALKLQIPKREINDSKATKKNEIEFLKEPRPTTSKLFNFFNDLRSA